MGWDFEDLGLWGVFLACPSLFSSFFSFIQHGYCYLRVKKKRKNSWHFAESSSKRLKYETGYQIWKGGGEEKQQLLSAYLLLSPAHSILIKHHGDVHVLMNISCSSWRHSLHPGDEEKWIQCVWALQLLYEMSKSRTFCSFKELCPPSLHPTPTLKPRGAEHILKTGWPQWCQVCTASQHSFWWDFSFFLVVLGLCCCSDFSLGKWGLLSSCDTQASHWGGFFCCGAQAPGHTGFSICGTWA